MELEDDTEAPKKIFKFPAVIFKFQGKMYFHWHQFTKALACFDQVSEQEPLNLEYLCMRCKCLVALGQYENANNLCNYVLQLNPTYPTAVCLKGQLQYIRGDFERSLLIYNKGPRKNPNFALGFQVSKNAINNSLGSKRKVSDNDIISMQKVLSGERKIKGARPKIHKPIDFMTDVEFLETVVSDRFLKGTTVLLKSEKLLKYAIERERVRKMLKPRK